MALGGWVPLLEASKLLEGIFKQKNFPFVDLEAFTVKKRLSFIVRYEQLLINWKMTLLET